MGKVKEHQMNVQYVMNVLSATGNPLAIESLEEILKYCTVPEDNVQDKPLVTIGQQLNTVGEVRQIMADLDDSDQICIETCDEHGDVVDLYPMYIDVIDNIKLTDGTVIKEIRFCQKPNSPPDTRDKQPLVDAVIHELKYYLTQGDESILDELLKIVPWEILKHKLPEDKWAMFDENTGE